MGEGKRGKHVATPHSTLRGLHKETLEMFGGTERRNIVGHMPQGKGRERENVSESALTSIKLRKELLKAIGNRLNCAYMLRFIWVCLAWAVGRKEGWEQIRFQQV